MTKEEIIDGLENLSIVCETNFQTQVCDFAISLINSQQKRIGELERDKQRLDWLLAYIQQNGSNGIEEMDWTVINEPFDEPDLLFDRVCIDAAIDAAINQTKDDNTRTIS